MSELPQIPAPRCVNLCSKALMVHGESFADDPSFQSGFDPTWCLVTGNGLGPDQADADWPSCTDTGRGCYKEF